MRVRRLGLARRVCLARLVGESIGKVFRWFRAFAWRGCHFPVDAVEPTAKTKTFILAFYIASP